jgi:hypothetical protein
MQILGKLIEGQLAEMSALDEDGACGCSARTQSRCGDP